MTKDKISLYPSDLLKLGMLLELSSLAVFLSLVLLAAMNFKTGNLTCWKSLNKLAKEMRCHKRSVQRAVKELESKKIIAVGKKRTGKGGLENNTYKFLLTDKDITTIRAWRPYAYSQHDHIHIVRKSLSLWSQCLSNITRGINKEIKPSINQADGSTFSNISEGHQANSSEEISISDADKDVDNDADNDAEDTDGVDAFDSEECAAGGHAHEVPYLSVEELKKLYGNKIKPVDLTRGRSKISLKKIIAPFYERQDLDKELSPWFEKWVKKYIDDVLREHWAKNVPMNTGGMEHLLKRFCRSGAAEHFGFDPIGENENFQALVDQIEYPPAPKVQHEQVQSMIEKDAPDIIFRHLLGQLPLNERQEVGEKMEFVPGEYLVEKMASLIPEIRTKIAFREEFL